MTRSQVGIANIPLPPPRLPRYAIEHTSHTSIGTAATCAFLCRIIIWHSGILTRSSTLDSNTRIPHIRRATTQVHILILDRICHNPTRRMQASMVGHLHELFEPMVVTHRIKPSFGPNSYKVFSLNYLGSTWLHVVRGSLHSNQGSARVAREVMIHAYEGIFKLLSLDRE